MFDVVVVGGGIMGCTTALHLARGGMRIIVLERRRLCMAASSVNSGTLSIQIKKPALIPYSVRAAELWRRNHEWLGEEIGFRTLGGVTVAFTEKEAELLERLSLERRDAGAPIEIMGIDRARELEPALADNVRLASFCPLDGYAHSYLTGRAFRTALGKAGAQYRENTRVDHIAPQDGGFCVRANGETVHARRVVLATNGWLEEMVTWLGCYLPPFIVRANQSIVTERAYPIFKRVISVANGRLTLKQTHTGSVIMGGGWQGIGDLESGGVAVIPENMINNIRLARYIIPRLSEVRVARAWVGVDSRLPDFLPLVGPLPGVEGAYVISSFGAGFTNGPIFGLILAQHILGRVPELPLFDPERVVRDRPYNPLSIVHSPDAN